MEAGNFKDADFINFARTHLNAFGPSSAREGDAMMH
jgi:hypothetical protein